MSDTEAILAIEQHLPKRTLLILICVTIGTTFGVYNSSVVNNLKLVAVQPRNHSQGMNETKHIVTESVWSSVVASFHIGSAVSTLFVPLVAEKAGRKIGLLACGLFGTVGGLLCIFHNYMYEFSIAGRFLMGVSFGIGAPLASLFVVEISPTHIRGAYSALLQAGSASGDIFGMLISMPQFLGKLVLIPLALGLTAITSMIMIMCVLCVPESPRYLILKLRDLDKGRRSLKFYLGSEEQAEMMLNRVITRCEDDLDQKSGIPKLAFALTQARFKTILIAIASISLSMISGISCIMAYSTDAYIANGISENVAVYASTFLGAANLVSSFGAVHCIEKMGRRKMLLLGLLGTFLGTASFSAISCVLKYTNADRRLAMALPACLILYAFFYSFLSAAGTTLASEVCHQSYRSHALALAYFVATLFGTGSIYSYNLVKNYLGSPYVFLPSTVLSLPLGLWLFVQVKETTGVQLEDITM